MTVISVASAANERNRILRPSLLIGALSQRHSDTDVKKENFSVPEREIVSSYFPLIDYLIPYFILRLRKFYFYEM